MIKKIIIKVIVFVAVVIATAFFVNKFNNLNADSISKEMEEAKLPLVYCEVDGKVVNLMSGYTQVMSTNLMRDGIVPLNEEYGVDILVDDESGYGETYSYEVRTIAGDSLVEEGEISPGTPSNGYKKYSFSFRMDMRENQEYVLVFIITNSQGEKARYYTRIAKLSEQYAVDIIDYAMEFHNTTFSKEYDEEQGNIITKALKTTGAGTDYDMYHVDLSASYDMVSWATLNPLVVTGIVPTITEIDTEYAVIKMTYVIESMKDGVSHYYNVDEYFSAIYNKNTQSVELLAYDRYIDSIFDENYISKDRNSICVGISDGLDVEYESTSDNKKIAFVKAGQLWYYDYTVGNLTSVFSFPQGNYTDIRTMNTSVDINIASMDEEGNIYFVVYGYMSRGEHEGKNGISLYYFTASDSKLQEMFFVQSDEPFDVMAKDTGRFTYYDEAGKFYYLLDGTIYVIDMESMQQDELVAGISSDKYIVSENRKIVAYPNTDVEEEVTQIVIHNFETGEVFTETGTSDDRFLALGFVGNDLIFGVANKDDIIISSSKEVILPLYNLYIVEPGGEIIKEYSKNNIYIMNARVETDKIYLDRSVKQNNFFDATEPDFISYKYDPVATNIFTKYVQDSYAMNQVDIVFPSNIYISDATQYVMTKSKVWDDYKEYKVKVKPRENTFYVFDNSGYVGETNSAGRAIVEVNEAGMGLVVDRNGNTVYRSLAATGYNTVADEIYEYPCDNLSETLMTCAYMCIEYIDSRVEYENVVNCESWEKAFEEYTLGVGLNISGIDLDTALYFLDRDIPFAACIDDGRYVLVISYNSTHIRYYDPMLDEEVKVTRENFKEKMSVQSNTMYTYTSQ